MIERLSKVFSIAGAKKLSAVEIKPEKSNQHELNGVTGFKRILGTEKQRFKAKFIFLDDDETKCIDETATLTWYDAREKHATRTEFRFYYTSNGIIERANVGDLVVVAKATGKDIVVIVCPAGSTSERQVLWLYGIDKLNESFTINAYDKKDRDLGFAGNYILKTLGYEEDKSSKNYLELILKAFGEKFPTTKEFSKFSREHCDNISLMKAPDEALLIFMQQEEMLFRTLEKHLVSVKLEQGFGKKRDAVDEFISYSLSIQNRRKSRAGFAFENHLEFIFKENNITFSKGAKTERNNTPDFLFPGITQYKNANSNSALLTMLGLKTSAKERWRQVLFEADKISPKHLITLEPAISKNQTDQMRDQQLQLVVPKGILATYSSEQQNQIFTLSNFIDLVRDRQAKFPNRS